MAIMSTPIDNELIQPEVVGRERLLLVTARDYELRAKSRATEVSALRDEPAVVLHEMHCLGQQIDAFCSQRRLTRRIVCRSTQLQTILRLVELGIGISFVPEMCARADESRQRRYRGMGKDGPTREIAIAYHVDRTRSHLAREFGAMLREEIGKHRYNTNQPKE
jgi:LysR family hydrogen peroxide-inducible transcriptional activator